MDSQQLGHRIRIAREKQGLSQEALAENLGVGQRAISELENGKRKLPVTDLPALAHELQVPILYFFEDDLGVQDLEVELINTFRQLPTMKFRKTLIEIVRLLVETSS